MYNKGLTNLNNRLGWLRDTGNVPLKKVIVQAGGGGGGN